MENNFLDIPGLLTEQENNTRNFIHIKGDIDLKLNIFSLEKTYLNPVRPKIKKLRQPKSTLISAKNGEVRQLADRPSFTCLGGLSAMQFVYLLKTSLPIDKLNKNSYLRRIYVQITQYYPFYLKYRPIMTLVSVSFIN